nr:MAG TPA: hypothetical protein [Caudoviricetes sp.]
MSKNKRSVIGVGLIVVIILCVIGIVKPKDKKGVSPHKETMKTKSTTQSETIETSEVTADNSEEDKYGTLDAVDIMFSDSVRDDQTGNWRLSRVTSNKLAEEYALDYYKKYFKGEQEVHAIVNYTLNTTACITNVGNKINIRVYEHIKDEEQHAKTLFTGQKLAEYNIDKSTGTIEKIEP